LLELAIARDRRIDLVGWQSKGNVIYNPSLKINIIDGHPDWMTVLPWLALLVFGCFRSVLLLVFRCCCWAFDLSIGVAVQVWPSPGAKGLLLHHAMPQSKTCKYILKE
jgi:hypothetical protein